MTLFYQAMVEVSPYTLTGYDYLDDELEQFLGIVIRELGAQGRHEVLNHLRSELAKVEVK